MDTEFTVTAILPFPIRLTGSYSVTTRRGSAELAFETKRRSRLDERIGVRGTFDFQIDRHGDASYTTVSGVVRADSPTEALATVVSCVNGVIQHLRNDLNLFWLGDLEAEDLFAVSVASPKGVIEQDGLGRARGVTLPITGLSAADLARLQRRLASHERVVEWRLLQLDAENASDLA